MMAEVVALDLQKSIVTIKSLNNKNVKLRNVCAYNYLQHTLAKNHEMDGMKLWRFLSVIITVYTMLLNLECAAKTSRVFINAQNNLNASMQAQDEAFLVGVEILYNIAQTTC